VATPLAFLPTSALFALGIAALALPAGTLDALLAPLARATYALLELADRVPGSPDPLPPRPFALVALASALALLAAAQARKRARTEAENEASARARESPYGSSAQAREHPYGSSAQARSRARAAAALGAALLLPWRPAPRALELVALDVGHGTAVAFRAPGAGTWVFDAGSRDRPAAARRAIGARLRLWEAGPVGVVCSHGDRDHDGALGWLLERHPPRRWLGALSARDRVRLPHTAAALDVGRGALLLDAGGGLALELSRGAEVAGNEGSRTLVLGWGGERLVLAGDASAEGLAAWLAARPPRPARLLLWPHHGAPTPWTAALLAHQRPAEVWISAPAVPALARELDRRGVRWRCTALEGTLVLEPEGAGTAGPRHATCTGDPR
jgi:beta-lactamase superfamily II metal-dependent hydrolase